MSAEDIIAAAIVELQYRSDVLAAQISLLHDAARSLQLSSGLVVSPADHAVVSLARAIIGDRS